MKHHSVVSITYDSELALPQNTNQSIGICIRHCIQENDYLKRVLYFISIYVVAGKFDSSLFVLRVPIYFHDIDESVVPSKHSETVEKYSRN